MMTTVEQIAVDPELTPGASNAINVCLRLKPEERITIITDLETLEICASLVQQIQRVGAKYSVFVLRILQRVRSRKCHPRFLKTSQSRR